MALEFIHISVPYSRLLELLRITEYGSAFRNLYALESLGASIYVAKGSMDELNAHLTDGRPLLAFVNSGQLHSYWKETTNHVVMAIGFQDKKVFVHDPYFATGCIEIDASEFELAWLEQDYLYAVIERRV